MGLFRIIFLSLILTVFSVGIYDYLYNVEPNGCEMTYMYQNPEYVKIKLNANVKEKYPQYNLYFYGEGPYAQDAKSPKGIPVLFIPGNAGSYKQVRSLGSVALRMAESLKSNFHFNFFSLDLNDEYSALFGPLLQTQTEFAHECIKHILSLYTGNVRPTTVLLVGHSMGGMVARALFTLPDFDRKFVSTIITQATPHQMPVTTLDSYTLEFYERVNEYWRQNSEEEGKIGDVTVFSTGGGFRDPQVRSGLTHLKGLLPRDRSTSANTMSVPGAWVSTDHQCHVWCKQIVMSTVRALFDIVDKGTKQIAINPTFRVKPFMHHFVQNVGTKFYKASHDLMLTIPDSSTFEIRKKLSWKYIKEKVEVNKVVAVNLPKAEAAQHGYVAITNVDNVGWVGGCTVRDGRCTQVGNFARYANLIPPRESGLKVVQLDSYKLDVFEHWAVVIPKSDQPITMMYDLYELEERNFEYNVTSFLGFVKNFPSSIYKQDIVISSTKSRNIFYNISLSGLIIPLQAYTAIIETRNCKANSSEGADHAVAKFIVPWSGEHTYTVIPRGGKATVSLKLQTGKPDYPIFDNAELHLYLMPQCSYRVSVEISWKELPGQFFRFYAPYLPAYFVMQILMALSWQLMGLEDQGFAPGFIFSHARWAQPYRVCLVASVVKFLISYPEDDNFAKFLGLPEEDARVLQNSNMWYAALPVLLYLFAYTFIGIYSYVIHFLVVSVARTVNLVLGRCLKALRKPARVLQYVLLLGGAICSATLCGTIGIIVSYLIFVIKMFSSYIEGRESSLAAKASKPSHGSSAASTSSAATPATAAATPAAAGASPATGAAGGAGAAADSAAGLARIPVVAAPHKDACWNAFNVNFSLVLLLLMSVLLNAPSFIIWVENLKWGRVSLSVDPSSTSGILISLSSLLICYSSFPFTRQEVTSVMGGVSYVCCVLMVLYSTTSVYRVTHFISAVMVAIALPALLVSVLDRAARAAQPKPKTE